MPTPLLEKLLILQDRDKRRRDLEAQLAAVPRDIAIAEGRIATEKAAIDNAQHELRSLESKKKLLETEIGTAEQKLGRYRTQQLEVRKNDEYRALGHEIETMQAAIGKLEGEELSIMYEIDSARERFTTASATLKENITGHQARIAVLREREANLSAELVEAKAEVDKIRPENDASILKIYDRVAARNFPACVPVRASKCGGCHLKISSEVEGEIRGRDVKGISNCDQCGRIVYWDA